MNKRNTILLVLLLLLGIGILTYPMVSNLVNRFHGSYAIQEFQTRVENADITAEREKAVEYNEKIRDSIPVDGFASEQTDADDSYNGILNFGGGMMGYLQIPKIDVNLPIYHGTSEEVLAKGVGHLTQSALPIGGEGNHAVLTGHTGLPSAELFNDLTELQEGDSFYIGVLGEKLTYQVDQIKVVLPSEGQDLTAVPGEDYCTLVTCTPYGINTHRLLVRGHRVETELGETEPSSIILSRQNYRFLWLIAAAMALLLIALVIVLNRDISSYN